MSKKQKSRSAVAAAKQETELNALANNTINYNNTPKEETQENHVINMLEKEIPRGAENAIPARKLAARLGLSYRDTTKLIHNARKDGAVILSSNGKHNGYFFPADGEKGEHEIRDFVRSMDKRAKLIFVASKSARQVMKNSEQKGAQNEQTARI